MNQEHSAPYLYFPHHVLYPHGGAIWKESRNIPRSMNTQRHINEGTDFYLDTFFNPIWEPPKLPQHLRRDFRPTEPKRRSMDSATSRGATSGRFGASTYSSLRFDDISTNESRVPVAKHVPSKCFPVRPRHEPPMVPSNKNQNETIEYVSWPPVLTQHSRQGSASSSSGTESDVHQLETPSYSEGSECDQRVAPPDAYESRWADDDLDGFISKHHFRHRRVPFGILHQTKELVSPDDPLVHGYNRRRGMRRAQTESGAALIPALARRKGKGNFPRDRPVPPPLDMSLIAHAQKACDKVIHAVNGYEEAETAPNYDRGKYTPYAPPVLPSQSLLRPIRVCKSDRAAPSHGLYHPMPMPCPRPNYKVAQREKLLDLLVKGI